MGKTKMINSVRKIDVTVTELREIAWALDEIAISADVSPQADVTRPLGDSIRATRERIAPRAEFPQREGASLEEMAFNRGYDLGRREGGDEGRNK